MNIREKITAWEPGAVWSEAGDGMFTVPVEKFHALAARLRAEGFDFLRSLTGMDWGEEGLGTVYHLEATRTGANVVLRTLTADRPLLVILVELDTESTVPLTGAS